MPHPKRLMKTTEPNPNGSSTGGAALFAITAFLCLVLGCLVLALRPAFLMSDTLGGQAQQWVQLMLFGFGLPAVFAAVYWALPRAFDVPLFSSSSVYLHFGFHLAGLCIAMLVPFIPSLPQSSMGATFLACGGVVFVVNVAMSLRQLERPDASSAFLSTIAIWLLAALFLGIPFAAVAPLPMFSGTNWSAGWLVFLISGIFFNAVLGLALRVTPLVLGSKPVGSSAPWFALSFINLGVAWMFAATTFGPMPFLLVCAGAFLVGSIIYLADFWLLLQRRAGGSLRWDTKILLAAVWMIPASALALMYDAWQRVAAQAAQAAEAAAPAVAAVAAPAAEGPAPIAVSSLDWTVGLIALLGAAVPGLVAIVFQLQQSRAAHEESTRERLAGQLLLASFFNYAVGVVLVVVGAWGAENQMLGLGAVFLLVGSIGFLGNFIYSLMASSGAPREAAASATA